MFDFLGGLLDNPGRSVGLQPDQMDPRARHLLRMQTLSALGGQLAGQGNFFDSMRQIRDVSQKDAAARAQQEAQKRLQALFAGSAPQQVDPTQAALGAPVAQAGPVGPTPQRAQLQQGFAQAPQVNPNRAKAETYRKAAEMVAATNPDLAEKYMSLAEKIDPREEYMAPVATDQGFIMPSKTGAYKALEGVKPPAPAQPAAIQEYQFAVNQGYKGTFDQWDTARRRAAATNVSVNAEKPFINTLAGDLGGQVAASRDQAVAAQGTLSTIEQIRTALPTAITGPGADARAYLARLQTVLGVGGASDQERLANTALVVQGLAQAELSAAQMAKGQGPLTDSERAIIRRAASGDINMVPSELNALMNAVEKAARSKIQTHQANVHGLQQIPGMAPLMPFFQGPTGAPPAGVPGAAPSAASVQEAARQELIRRRQGGR